MPTSQALHDQEGLEPVTLCIAAACKHEGIPAIALCTDCRTEKGLASYSEGRIGSNDADKIRRIGTSFAALLAGGPTNADQLLAKCDAAVLKFEKATANKDSDIIITEFLEDLKKRRGVDGKKLSTTTSPCTQFSWAGKNSC